MTHGHRDGPRPPPRAAGTRWARSRTGPPTGTGEVRRWRQAVVLHPLTAMVACPDAGDGAGHGGPPPAAPGTESRGRQALRKASGTYALPRSPTTVSGAITGFAATRAGRSSSGRSEAWPARRRSQPRTGPRSSAARRPPPAVRGTRPAASDRTGHTASGGPPRASPRTSAHSSRKPSASTGRPPLGADRLARPRGRTRPAPRIDRDVSPGAGTERGARPDAPRRPGPPRLRWDGSVDDDRGRRGVRWRTSASGCLQ